MNPGYGTPVLLQYGNGASSNGSLPAISNQLTGGLRASHISPPTITPPKLPMIERLTPRRINATGMIALSKARVQTNVTIASQRAVNAAKGYVNAIRAHR